MSRRAWRCRYRDCPDEGGAILGHLTGAGDLVLAEGAGRFAVHVDTRRAVVWCRRCRRPREFRGGSVFSGRAVPDAPGTADAGPRPSPRRTP